MWLRDGEQITLADGYDIVVDGTKHKLVIRRASLDDEAEYTVMVGNNESSTMVFVEGESVVKPIERTPFILFVAL